ncbi:MAG: cyclic nucleotide-binding domain-containing protein [Candidatus Riflebacteria bacterium]|nr:cyclic nucleotide-binding domain-containing protein [Candidatus Riflebacteria bacterium]
MTTNPRELLCDQDLLTALVEDERRALEPLLTFREVDGQERLYSPGDPADGLDLVVAGRLQVERPTHDTGAQVVEEIGPGRSVGQVESLTGERRFTGASAIRDSVLLHLSMEACGLLATTAPSILLKIAQATLRWRHRPVVIDRALTVALVPFSGRIAATDLAAELSRALAPTIRTTYVNAQQADQAAGPGAAAARKGQELHRRVVAWLSGLERQHSCVLYAADHGPTEWTRRCLRQADLVLMLASSGLDRSAAQQEGLPTAPCGPATRELVRMQPRGAPLSSEADVWIGVPGLQRHHLLREGDEIDLKRLAASIAAHSEVPGWLRKSRPFASLDESRLRLLQREFQLVHLGGQEELFAQGDPGDSLYVVVSGRLQALQPDAQAGLRPVHEMGPGDILGEIALIAGERRTATVRALRDSVVARLPKAAFDRLVMFNPEIGLHTSRVIAERLLARGGLEMAPRAINLAVVPLDREFDVCQLVEALGQGLSTLGKAAALGARTLEAHLGRGASSLPRGAAGDAAVAQWLNRFDLDHDFVVYQADPTVTPWTQRCLRQADRILLVAEATAPSVLRSLEEELFQSDRPGCRAKRYLVLVHPGSAERGRDTASWLDGRELAGHHHVRRGWPEDFARLARCVTDRAVGLALGGGGYRGLAHIGVYRALMEHGVPIDVLAGTSSGAIVAGLIACGNDPKTALEKATGLVTATTANILTMGPPLVSLMSGAHQARVYPQLYGGAQIEDLFLGCTVVAADWHRGCEVLLRRGPMWLAVRASSSLPGIWPPVQLGGRTLVDGGVFNNLPMEVLQPGCSGGAIIASDLSAQAAVDPTYHQYGHSLSGWKLLLRQLSPFPVKVPSLFDVISGCVTLADLRRRQQSSMENVLYLPLPLQEFGMFDIRDPRSVAVVEERGYAFTRKALEGWAWKR